MNLKLALLSLSCARIRASGDATDLDIPGGSGPGGGGGPGGGASVPAGTESNTCRKAFAQRFCTFMIYLC